MELCFNTEYLLLALLSYSRLTETVVPEYCIQPLNNSDCGLKPTAVISYWKPGSRCEVEYWRGCPTLNKFDNEYECSLVCIFQMRTLIEENIDECRARFNGNRCNKTHIDVYTFKNGECVKVTWKGCTTLNKFNNEADCIRACAEDAWQNNLNGMKIQQLKYISDVLDIISQTEANLDSISQTEANLDTVSETEAHLDTVSETEANLDTVSQSEANLDTASQTETILHSTTQTNMEMEPMSTEPSSTNELTVEIITSVTENIQTSTEVAQTTTEINEITRESTQTATETITTEQATTAVITTITEAIQTTTEAIQTTTEAIQATTEAIQITTEAIQTTTEAIQTTTEAITTTTEYVEPEEIDDVVSARKRAEKANT